MSNQEILYHIRSDLDYYEDLKRVNPDSNKFDVHIRALKAELDLVREQPITPQTQTLEQPITPQTQTLEKPIKRHPSGWTPVNWPPSNENACVLITTCRLTVSSFVRSMIMNLRPFFSVIMPLVLSALVIISIPFIIEIYTMLTSILGEFIGSAVEVLFLVILFLSKLLLMIRRAKKSAVLYDKFFNFTADHYSSGILYFFI